MRAGHVVRDPLRDEVLWGNARRDGLRREQGGEPFGAGAPSHPNGDEASRPTCPAHYDPGHPGGGGFLIAQPDATDQTQHVVRPHLLHSSASLFLTRKLASWCWRASGEASRPDRSIEPSWRAEAIASASASRIVSTSSASGSAASTPSMRRWRAPSREKEVTSYAVAGTSLAISSSSSTLRRVTRAVERLDMT